MSDWITDEFGNSASISFFGSEEKAKFALASLTNCKNCINYMNCSNCFNCGYCFACSNCSNCSNCLNCRECMNCSNCSHCSNCDTVIIAGPIRSDGYQFVITKNGHIRAGCRNFATFEEARQHWQWREGTKLGEETNNILNFLEIECKRKNIIN